MRKRKTERIFDLARYIGSNGAVGIDTMRELYSDLSERGVFRYLTTLIRAGVATRYKSRYTIDDYWASLLQNVEAAEAVRGLIAAGMEACDDEEVLEKARLCGY